MATIKQMKMLAARARDAGVEWNFDDGKELENGEIDAKLEEFSRQKQLQEAQQAKVAGEQKRFNHHLSRVDFDSVRFGLACKLVVMKAEKGFLPYSTFKYRVTTLYDMMMQVERDMRGEA